MLLYKNNIIIAHYLLPEILKMIRPVKLYTMDFSEHYVFRCCLLSAVKDMDDAQNVKSKKKKQETKNNNKRKTVLTLNGIKVKIDYTE